MKDPLSHTGIATAIFATIGQVAASVRAFVVTTERKTLQACDYLESFLPGMRSAYLRDSGRAGMKPVANEIAPLSSRASNGESSFVKPDAPYARIAN